MATRRTRAEDTGVVDQEMTEYAARLEAQFRPVRALEPPPSIRGVERVGPRSRRTAGAGPVMLAIEGSGFTLATMGYLDGQPLSTRFVSESRIEVELPAHLAAAEARFGQIQVSDGPPASVRVRIGAEDIAKGSVSVTSRPEVPKAGRQFSLVVAFGTAGPAAASILQLDITFPNGQEQTGYFRITAREAKAGIKRVGPFVARSWGPVKVAATIYTSDGGASTARARIEIVPANPFQVWAYPQYSGFTWKGAARYNSGDKYYYCHARAVFSNGNNFAVTVNRPVTVRVTDGGSHVTTFTFNLTSSVVVPANSSRTIYFYTRHKGSSTAKIFEKFGDVTMRYTFSTTAGAKSSSAVFVMMGQVKVACNFVGAFTSGVRGAVRNLTLGRASSIWEQVDLAITSAPILLLPSSHSDWGRFRDIRIDSCKNGVSSDEAGDMRAGWSSPATYSKHIDLWFVESFSGASCAASTGGFSPRPGPASKNGRKSGVVIDVNDLDILNSTWGSNVMGVVIAHELGHYLGLKHHDSSMNFMAASTGGANLNITWDQHNKAAKHDWVLRLNP